ncbi:putative RNA recognition motif domain, nucleotide-binding alpha-beta plait domain superfamily [Helianthus anomalus]
MEVKITKLFVSNLPEGCTPWELRKGLERFRAITGSYVARKRDKGGCRFGFVSFKDIKDKSEFVKSLAGGGAGQQEVKGSKSKATGVFSGGKPQLRDGRSYSDVVGKSLGGGGPNWVQQPDYVQGYEKYVVVPDKTGAFSSLFGLALVGRVVNLETLVDFDKLLSIAKVSVANIQYLGGLSLLISFHDVEAAKKFLDSKVIWGP